MSATSNKLSRRGLLQAAGGVALLGSTPLLFESECLSVEHHRLALPNWTAGPVRLGVISDFHMTEPLHVARAARALELLDPWKIDFLVMPGDFVEGSDERAVRCLRAFLKHVRERDIPSVAVLGNHDVFGPGTQVVWTLSEFRKAGVQVLLNEMVDYNGLLFVGLEDGLNAEPRPELFPKDKAPRNVVCLMHEPGLVTRMPRHFSLQISGHTHGGQVCLPGGICLFRPRLGGGYRAGYFPQAPIPLYVTRGIGTTGLPFRAYCRPEVTVLDLDSA